MTTSGKRPPRDITDLARNLRYAWDIACAAVPFDDDLRDYIGVIHGGGGDPRYIVLINARQTAFEHATAKLMDDDSDYTAEPWMVAALRAGIIPGSGDGSRPGSQVIAPEGMSHRD